MRRILRERKMRKTEKEKRARMRETRERMKMKERARMKREKRRRESKYPPHTHHLTPLIQYRNFLQYIHVSPSFHSNTPTRLKSPNLSIYPFQYSNYPNSIPNHLSLQIFIDRQFVK